MEQSTESRPYQVDFDKYREEKEEKRVKPGTYPAKITNIRQTTTRKAPPRPMFVFEVSLTDSKHAGENFKLYVPIQENTMWKVEETWVALGLVDDEGKASSEPFEPDDLIGQPIGVVIGEDEYQGELVARLERFVSHYDVEEGASQDIPF